MAERFATQIKIGGTFTLTDQNVEAFETFVSHLQELAPDWGEKLYYITDIGCLDEAINKDGFIYGCDDDKAYGNFEDIEVLCQELDISFDRDHNPKHEYDGEFVCWRPGMKSPHYSCCNADGNRYLTESEVTAVMKEKLFNDELASLADRISNFAKHIDKMINGGVDPLEPFKMIDARTVVTESVRGTIDGMNEITVQIVYESTDEVFPSLFIEVKSLNMSESEMRENINELWDDFVAGEPDTDSEFAGFLNGNGHIAKELVIDNPLVLRG